MCLQACNKEFAWISVPVLDPEDDNKRVQKTLPFIDPHEYLEFLWRSEHVTISDEQIQPLSTHTAVLRLSSFKILICILMLYYNYIYICIHIYKIIIYSILYNYFIYILIILAQS